MFKFADFYVFFNECGHTDIHYESKLSSHERHFIKAHVKSSPSAAASKVNDDEESEKHCCHHDKDQDLVSECRLTARTVRYTDI